MEFMAVLIDLTFCGCVGFLIYCALLSVWQSRAEKRAVSLRDASGRFEPEESENDYLELHETAEPLPESSEAHSPADDRLDTEGGQSSAEQGRAWYRSPNQ